MGSSFLLALMQALLNLRWSYAVYPALVIAGITVCCLAVGFPLSQTLRPMRRGIRLALLALPAFSLGGLVFGANLGFLPQTIGLALGAGFLFAVGPMLRWVVTTNSTWLVTGKAALPGVVLLTGAIFAYSEITPFLLMAFGVSGFVLAMRFRAWGRLLVCSGVLIGLSILLLNTELLRAYAALRTQSGAVVGSPVDWSLLGYIAHAFGVHGGAWDGFQWSSPENAGSLPFVFGLLLLGLVIGVVAAEKRTIWNTTMNGALMPAVVVLIVFISGILYFRYYVPSPFQKGIGQSWSQFKLADWAHPFVMAVTLLAVASLKPRLGKLFDVVVVVVFAIGLVSASLIGVKRTAPLMHYYSGMNDLNYFYNDFRSTVISTCPRSAPIYLALGGKHHKFRQMAVLYLYDRVVTSDWMDDGYIFPRLPVEHRSQELTAGSCVVEPLGQDGWLSQGTTVGPFLVGIFDGHGRIRISSVTGGYDRESDGSNWWHWVENKISFNLKSLFVPKDVIKTKLSFEYGTRGKQTLTLRITKRDMSIKEFLLPSNGDVSAIFEKIIDVPPSELAEISIETDGNASPLGGGDARSAAWIVKNVSISPIIP